jgi:hypothetical protein
MPFSDHEFPDMNTISEKLNSALRETQSVNNQVTILNRERNTLASTFPSEIITCKMGDGSERQIFVKYSAGLSHNSYGHRGDIPYEIEVYRQVLQNIQSPSPFFYGAYQNEPSGEAWIFIQNFEDELRVKASIHHASMHAAARWLGGFHKENGVFLSKDMFPFLNIHDGDYYLGWAKRTSLFAGHLHEEFPWLENLCEQFGEVIDNLLAQPLKIIHGEFYPDNILYYEEEIYPVDWESAAIAKGEIDLASLIDNWSEKVRVECINEYQTARWPEGPPSNFETVLETAELYWHFRWLGDRPEWTTHENDRWRFEEIHRLGERLELI